ncbi:MAG: hypothetical protein V4597_05570 [Pseudomonadota bacterium]
MRLSPAAAAILTLVSVLPTAALAQNGAHGARPSALSAMLICPVSDPAKAAVAGVRVGKAKGYAVCKLQDADRDRALVAIDAALDQGGYQVWDNEQTGTSGAVRVLDTKPYDGKASLDPASYAAPAPLRGARLASGVKRAPRYDVAEGQHTAKGAIALRAAPAATGRKLAELKDGEHFDVLARVSGTGWLLAGRDGVGLGYVPETVAWPIYASRGAYIDADSRPLCRIFEVHFNPQGGPVETRRHTACQGADGQWLLRG